MKDKVDFLNWTLFIFSYCTLLAPWLWGRHLLEMGLPGRGAAARGN